VANLPPVSTTPATNFATSFTSVVDTGGKFAIGVNDTGSKFAAGVNDTGGNLPPVSRHRCQICHRCQQHPKVSQQYYKKFQIEDFFHLPPVSLTPVVNLELRISP
jgi:hypothetical protein